MEEKEILEEMLKIQKANNKKFESMKKNLQFIAWIMILSIVFTAISLFPLLNKL